MTTQTSRSYMWNTRDRLGHGATGQVFAGYHRETGAQVAVKVLNRQSELRAIQNEIEAVRRIPRHDNIVQFLAYEEEKATQFPVIVMELCNSGSLYEVVDSPENAFGVEESQFKQVISDVAEGLHHLKRHSFAHRDIKPGNIMRCQLPDGSYVFKLADFGTARQLAPEQMFTSIYGTEEYLHPSMYERALINPRMKAAFKDKVDLWSVGATFFHVATGRLPYSPYAKRNDRTKMFDIISNKPEGAVMGWQIEPDGPTQYSKQLPDDILLSDGLKGLITPVMANLMENEFSKMWGFNKFFDEINRIVKMKVVDVFCISLCRCCKVYIDPNMPNGVQNLKELISIQTQLDSRHMELFYDNLPYHNKDQRAAHLPNTTEERPIVVFGGPPQKAENLQVPVLPTIPQRLPQISVVEDLRYAKECNRAVCAYLHFAEKMQQMFSLMHQSSHMLLEVINHEFSNLQDLSFRVKGISTAVNTVLLEQIAQLHSEVKMISAVNNPPNERLAFPLQKLESDRLFKQDLLNRRPMQMVSLRKTLKDLEPQLIQLREFWDPKLNCDVFDKSGARAMGFYVKAIQSLFQQLQQERNRIKSGIPTCTFDQKIHNNIKVQLENRLREAHHKLQQLVKARSEVYTKLHHFLGMCIALREDIGGFYRLLQVYEKKYNSQLEELEIERKEALVRTLEVEKELRHVAHQKTQDISRVEEQVAHLGETNRRLQEDNDHRQREVIRLQEEVRQLQSSVEQQPKLGTDSDISFWLVSHDEIHNTGQVLGKGGWGNVTVGSFRGKKVAIKELHSSIRSSYYDVLLRREISLMAKVRHPNLLLFIAAVLDMPNRSDPIIITELLDTDLRKAYQNNQLANNRVRLFILRDVAAALNYLHLQREPIIHRDVSSANVLLQALPDNRWRGKLSDFGSANIVQYASTPGPGNRQYMAPEVLKEEKQSTKMDVYSYGKLFCEVFTSQFPDQLAFPSMLQSLARSWPLMHKIIIRCVEHDPVNRPTMSSIVDQLNVFTQ